MMLARVAGVPRPESFIASAASSSSTSLPAVSIDLSRLPSLKRAGGLVLLACTSTLAQVSRWPTVTDGSVRSLGSSSPSSLSAAASRAACFSTRWRRMASTAYQPGSMMTVPLLRKVLSPTAVMMVVSSSLAGGRNTARKRRATMS